MATRRVEPGDALTPPLRLSVDLWLESRGYVEQLDSLLDMARARGPPEHLAAVRLRRSVRWVMALTCWGGCWSCLAFSHSAPELRLGPHPSQGAVIEVCRPCRGFLCANPRAATSLLTALARRSLWDVSSKAMRFMQDAAVDVNHFHYTSVISACEKQGRWQMVLAILEDMQNRLVLASEVTYNATWPLWRRLSVRRRR